MKKIFILALATIIGCNSNEKAIIDFKQKVTPSLKTYFSNYLKGQSIDTIDIYKIDTLTLKKLDKLKALEYNKLLDEVSADLVYLDEKGKSYQKVLDIENNKWANDGVADLRIKCKEDTRKGNMYLTLFKRSINRWKFDDSVKFLNYIVYANIKKTDERNVQSNIDSVQIIVTKDFKVKDKMDYVKKEISDFEDSVLLKK